MTEPSLQLIVLKTPRFHADFGVRTNSGNVRSWRVDRVFVRTFGGQDLSPFGETEIHDITDRW